MGVIGKFESAMKLMQNDRQAQLFLEKRKQHIKVSPKYLGNLTSGIRQHLSALLSRQDAKFDGFPVAYSNIKIEQALGKLISDQGCIHFDIQADFVVFKPVVGCKLTGKVNKISKRHLGCLVHGHFNAWVPQTSATEKLAASVLMDAQLEFTVQGVDASRNVLSIKGKLEKILDERIHKQSLSLHPVSLTMREKRQQRKQAREEENRLKNTGGNAGQTDTKVDKEKNKKKKSKKKKLEQQENYGVIDENELSADVSQNKTPEDSDHSNLVDSGVNLESEQDITDRNVTEHQEVDGLGKHKKKDKKTKIKNISVSVSSINNCQEEKRRGQCSADASINSVESFDPVFTSTQVDHGNLGERNMAKKKKKKHKKDKTDMFQVSSQAEMQPIANGYISDREVIENNDKRECVSNKSRKRHHEEPFTGLKSLDEDSIMIEPSPAKKGKTEESCSMHEIRSQHLKKFKKKKKHKE